MSGVSAVVIVLDSACIMVWAVWILPSTLRYRRQAKAAAQRACEAVAAGTLVIPESYRQQLAHMAEVVARNPPRFRYWADMADRLRKVTGLPDAALALVLAEILRMAREVDEFRGPGPSRFDVFAGRLLGAAVDLSSLERDLSAR